MQQQRVLHLKSCSFANETFVQEKRWELLEQAARQVVGTWPENGIILKPGETRHGLSLVCDPVPFAAASFPGYESKRNSTGRRGCKVI